MKYVLVNLIKSLTFSVERKNLINKERLTPEGIFQCLQCFSWSVYKSHPLNRLKSSLKIPATLQAWRAKPSTRQSKSLYFRNDRLHMNGIWIDWCVQCIYFCKAFIIFFVTCIIIVKMQDACYKISTWWSFCLNMSII